MEPDRGPLSDPGKIADMDQHIIRRRKRRRKFDRTRIEGAIFTDSQISWAAKGLLAYITATENEESSRGELWALAPDRQEAERALAELEDAGYVEFKKGAFK